MENYIFNGKIHYKSQFSIAMLNYQRVCLPHPASARNYPTTVCLLVYNWSDGWSPLSHFLGTGIPEEEFPHEDKAKTWSTTKIEAKLGMTHAFLKRQVIVDGI